MAYINPPTQSKIILTQILGAGLTLLTVTYPELVPLVDAVQSPEVQAAAIAGIAIVGNIVTTVLRARFTAK